MRGKNRLTYACFIVSIRTVRPNALIAPPYFLTHYFSRIRDRLICYSSGGTIVRDKYSAAMPQVIEDISDYVRMKIETVSMSSGLSGSKANR